MKTQSPLLQAALQLQRQGCSLISVGPDKKPLVSWKEAQSERATSKQLESWFAGTHAHGVAIVTGTISGRVVLDIDGDEGFEALLTRGFQLPPTLTIRTPRGGSHFYFEDPGLATKNFAGGTSSCPLPKVDFRGDGGYAVCPPTPGYSYVEPLPLAPLPDWLRALVIPGWSMAEKAIASATAGTRNETGFKLACALRDHGLSQPEAQSLMAAYATAVRARGTPEYTEREALNSLESAFSHPARSAQNGISHAANKRSQASQLVELAASIDLFHTPEHVAYATISIGTHRENWPIKSKTFRQWLSKTSYERTGQVPNGTALADALAVLEGQALYSGRQEPVFVRVAQHGLSIVIDLSNDAWEVVVIEASGWHVEQRSPVKFRRSRGLLPLPEPTPGGSLDELRGLLNIGSDDDWKLLVAWVLASLRPCGPYPVLVLQGEQGSGKSTATRILRGLIDPNVSPARSEPRDIRDLLISANNSWVLAFDNLSHIPPWLSDALCRLSTGGGLATRELYTDTEEILLDAQRPSMLNGIEALITRSDLLDRALLTSFVSIDDIQRRTEADLLRRYEEVRSRLFGAVISALSKTLSCLPHIQLAQLPRMADFAIFGTAVEQALGWPTGSFLRAYDKSRTQAHTIALDSSSIVAPLEELLSENSSWTGTARDLLTALEHLTTYDVTRRKGWPATERQLGAQLSRLGPNLRAIGITIEKDRCGHARTRMITLSRSQTTALSASSASSSHMIQCEALADNTADKGSQGVVRRNVRNRAVPDMADNADKRNVPSGSCSSLQKLGELWRRTKPIHEAPK